VILSVFVSLSPVMSSTRIVTRHAPGAGAVVVAVPPGELASNSRSPLKSHRVITIGVDRSTGVDVDVNVTGVPATTGFGAQSKSAFGRARATPAPSGDTTAPTVSRQAASTSLT
jgi:hypothetical protein